MIRTLLTVVVTLSLIGCSTTVPVTAKFPEAPGKQATTQCPDLKKLNEDAKLSDVAKMVTINYGEYYTCAVKVDAWIEWYSIQKQIFENIK
jgi:hypothetical protein